MLHEDIKNEVKKAMLEKNPVKLSVIRSILADFTNELVAKKRKPDEMLSDDEALAVISKNAKRRKDSIEQFAAGGRQDLVDKETEELKYTEGYLPQMMGRDEIRKLAEIKKDELGIDDKAKAGLLMAALMRDLKGKADGNDVKAVVDEILS